MAINLPRWDDCTTEQHIRAGEYSRSFEMLRAAEEMLAAASARWQAECQDADPDFHRGFYRIDELAAQAAYAHSRAVAFASAY